MEGAEHGLAAAEEGEELAAREVGQRRHPLEVGVDLVEEVLGQAGHGRPEAADLPGRAGLAEGGDRVEPAADRALGDDLAGQLQVDGHVALDGDDDQGVGQVLLGGGAGQRHRLADGVAQRRHPQVALELGERLGERLGHRPRPVHRAAGHAPHLGGDGAGLQQPQVAVVRDGPLDVLRAAEGLGHVARQLRERPEVRPLELGPVVGVELEDSGVGVEQVAGAVDLAADERLGAAPHDRHDPAVAAAGDRVDAEHDAAERRVDERLHQHADGLVGRARPLAGAQDLVDGVDELVEAVDADHRVELAGHRRLGRVLDHRRAAGDQVALVAARPVERVAHRRVRRHVGPAVDRVGEGGGQDHAAEGRQAVALGAGQGGRLAAGERDLAGRLVVEVDDIGGRHRTPVVNVLVIALPW